MSENLISALTIAGILWGIITAFIVLFTFELLGDDEYDSKEAFFSDIVLAFTFPFYITKWIIEAVRDTYRTFMNLPSDKAQVEVDEPLSIKQILDERDEKENKNFQEQE